MAVVKNEYDVIVIGGGVSGLMAALEISKTGKKVIIVDATNRIGGRVFTLKDDISGRPIELGAEFVHGKLDLTQMLIKKAEGQLIKAGDELWQHRDAKLESQDDFIEDYSVLKKKYKELEHDVSISHFLEQKLSGDQYRNLRESIKDYVEGYYAADTSRSSTSALIEEWEESESSQYRINEGYDIIIQYLSNELGKTGCFIQLLSPVSQINWGKNFVEVITNKEIINGHKLLITVSLGVLQSDQLVFTPAISDKINAAQALGYGGAFKLVFHFDNYFWKEHKGKDLSKMSFLFSEEFIPTWWTQVPADAPIITGWLAGPKTKQLEYSTDEKIFEEGLRSLGN
ncbi:MAG TPA: FAD-dependent oxidoreductase, partial [Chitinophagaceae bacterium]